MAGVLGRGLRVLRERGITGLSSAVQKRAREYSRKLLKSTTVTPTGLMLEVTNLCNLKCITCPREYELGDRMAKGMMDFEHLKTVVDEAAPYLRRITLTGLGETLLYRRLPEALDYIHEKTSNVHTFISTNAHLPRMPQLIAPISDKLSTIQISMDGLGEVYDSVRLKGNYGTFIDNVKTVVAMSGASIQFNMVVFETNYRQMADVVKVAHEVGVTQLSFNTMNKVTMPSLNRTGYDFYTTDALLDEYQRAHDVASELGVKLTGFDFEAAPGFQKCIFPWDDFYVSWDGYLVPCCAKPFPLEKNFGNVFGDGLMACLNSPEYREFRREWYANRTPAFCGGCHVIDTPRIADPRISGRGETPGGKGQTGSGPDVRAKGVA